MKKYFLILIMAPMMVSADVADLTGQVTNNQNQAIPNATIHIHNTELTTKTDESGQFVFSDLETGAYKIDIEISASRHFNTQINHDGSPIIINVDNLTLDDLVVSANPLEHNQLRMTTPVTILSEEDLVMERGMSIDQTLNNVTGVNSGSFGLGAGQIVIRGQQGPRVTVLNNNMTMQDAASVSPDHWVTTEPLLAKQVEVLKGPATLLYGGGAVGGVVNVLDDVIPSQQIDGIEGGFETRFSDSALGERTGVLTLNAGLSERLMGHVSYFNRQTDDYEIPDNAESEILHDAEGHDDHADHEGEESLGVLENSSIDADGFNVGLSWFYDQGYWGMSYADFNRNYGIPGHDHEYEDDHDDGHKDEDDHDHEEEVVRIDLDKTVFNLKGVHNFYENNYFNQLKTHYSKTDYQHVELEGDEIGTLFDNQSDEFRLELTHGLIGGFEGVWGTQFSNRDFAALGDEAYILPTKTEIMSLFLIEEREFENWHAEFGARYDRQSVSSDLYEDIDENALSLSLGATFNLTDEWTLPVNISSAQRLPTAEEYFSNQSGTDELIPHLATGTIEVGNLNLTQETANNFDVGLKYRRDGFRFDLALFYNQIDDFIFLRNTGEEVEEIPVYNYTQQNTTFRGYESEIGYMFEDGFNNQWNLRLFVDHTQAELNTGENVPRIPADRIGLGVNWIRGPWSINADHIHVSKQSDIAVNELPTEGYDLLNLSANWVHYGSQTETMVFIKANNVLDEEIRDHASFIKDIAPRPGRSISTGIRLTF
jgi:iron complex outermembrane receptor protein